MAPDRYISHAVVMMGYYTAEIPGHQTLFNYRGEKIDSVHGYDWEKVMWGEPGKQLGRLPMALYLAEELGAERIIFAIGNAHYGNGKTEAEWMREYVRRRRSALVRDFGDRFGPDSCIRDAVTFDEWLKEALVLEDSGYNSSTAMIGVARIIKDPKQLRSSRCMAHFVSSANHGPRVLRDARRAFQDFDFGETRVIVSCAAAETCYGDKGMEAVEVFDRGVQTSPEHWVKPT